MIFQVWKRPFSISFPPEEQLNKQLEIDVAVARINAGLSNLITETANLYSVNKVEAEKIWKENMKINEKYPLSMPSDKEGNNKKLPLVATWEDSTYYIGEATRYKDMQYEMGARKKYQVGRYFKGALESETQGLLIRSDTTWGTDMTNLQESHEFSFYITEKIQKEDIFKLYIVKRFDTLDDYRITPDLYINNLVDRNSIQVLFIREVKPFYAPNGKYCYNRLVLESLNDKLANTGYSIANYIQFALAGVGFAWPRLKLFPKAEIPLNQRKDVYSKS